MNATEVQLKEMYSHDALCQLYEADAGTKLEYLLTYFQLAAFNAGEPDLELGFPLMRFPDGREAYTLAVYRPSKKRYFCSSTKPEFLEIAYAFNENAAKSGCLVRCQASRGHISLLEMCDLVIDVCLGLSMGTVLLEQEFNLDAVEILELRSMRPENHKFWRNN